MNAPSSTDKKTDYAEHAVLWESSELSQSAYCARHDLNYLRLVSARSKLLASRAIPRKQKKSLKFIPVRPKPSAQEVGLGPRDSIIIRLAKGAVVEVPADLGTKPLNAIFKALS